MKKRLTEILAALCALSLLAGCSRGVPAPGSTGQTSGLSGTDSFAAAPPADPMPPETAQTHLTRSDGLYVLTSPDGSVAIRVDTNEQLSYSVTRTRDGIETEWIRPSRMGISLGSRHYFQNSAPVAADVREVSVSFPFMGNQDHIDGHCMEAVIAFSEADDPFTASLRLELRAYDNGVAFRYTVPGSGPNRNLAEDTTYALRSDVSECWYGVDNQDYEAVIGSHRPSEKSGSIITAPLTAVVGRKEGYIAIMEGALTDNYPGVNLKAEGNATYSTCFYTTPTVSSGSMTSGWRLISLADSLNDLVNNYNIYTVNEQPGGLYENTGWIVPGRSAWSWCTDHGAPTPGLMREYTLQAAMLGYEYNIIDDGWPGWPDYRAGLTELGVLGENLGVKQLLWGAVTSGTEGCNRMPNRPAVDSYLRLLAETHMYGAKVDFWWSEANTNTTKLQKYVLEAAAKRKLLIDFHGCNKNTGLNVTYPNELSREAVRGLENIGNSNTSDYRTYSSWLNAQLYTRYLCGHADWTPGTYSAMELASLICVDSPLMVVASDPEDILASPALEFIKSVPTVWDRTVVLPQSSIGAFSVYAKEQDGVWYVGGIASKTRTGVTVDLSEFLPPDGGVYNAEIWTDSASGMVCRNVTVNADGKIDIGSLAPGRGFAIRLGKLSLSRYGGQTGSVTVSAPGGAVVKYTLDGSDPLTSATAAVCDGTIEITGSCVLRAAIAEGDGAGSALSCRFNRISPLYSMSHTVDYEEGRSIVKFEKGEGVSVYYTLDGSEPTADSPEAGDGIEVTQACTLKYLAVCGSDSVTGSIAVSVRRSIGIPKPDIPLTDASPSAPPSVGWGNAHYDSSMASDNGLPDRKISLGGTDENNGTLFDRGICSNAVSTYRYAIPEGVSRFVAVAGIDDVVWLNTVDRYKASGRLILSVDGKEVYRSDIFRVGGYVYVDIEIPEGASELTIRFDDAGDGNTCDNVALGAPGWMR